MEVGVVAVLLVPEPGDKHGLLGPALVSDDQFIGLPPILDENGHEVTP